MRALAGFAYRHRYQLVLFVLALSVALGGAWLQVRTAEVRATAAVANQTLQPGNPGLRAVADVTAAVQQIFSYSYKDTAATARAADRVLTGAAAAQYRVLYSQITAHAAAQKVSQKTTVVAAGVTELTRSRATVLVFCDQRSTRAGTARTTVTAAQLLVTAQPAGGRWRVTAIRAV